jgi:hypothetical protein
VLDSVKGHRLARSKHYKVAKEDAFMPVNTPFIGRKTANVISADCGSPGLMLGLSQIENGPNAIASS